MCDSCTKNYLDRSFFINETESGRCMRRYEITCRIITWFCFHLTALGVNIFLKPHEAEKRERESKGKCMKTVKGAKYFVEESRVDSSSSSQLQLYPSNANKNQQRELVCVSLGYSLVRSLTTQHCTV